MPHNTRKESRAHGAGWLTLFLSAAFSQGARMQHDQELTVLGSARLSTLEAICRTLDCQPGDLIEFTP